MLCESLKKKAVLVFLYRFVIDLAIDLARIIIIVIGTENKIDREYSRSIIIIIIIIRKKNLIKIKNLHLC